MTLKTPVAPRAAPRPPSTARPPRLGRRGDAAAGRLPLQLLLSVLGLGAGLACAGDHVTREPPGDPEGLYWDLELNHRAVTLSLLQPYDTLTVTAIPRDLKGEPLDTLGAPQYSSPDVDLVQVTPEGVLQAVGLTAPGQPIAVVATLTAGNVKHVDTVLVKVVADTLPKLASLSILADSAKIPMGPLATLYLPLPIQGVDNNDSPISDLLIAVRSSDPLTAVIGNSLFGPLAVEGKRPGEVTLVASATVFGAARADTVRYRVGWPLYALVRMLHVPTEYGDLVDPPAVRVGVGALVRWELAGDTPIDVTFTDEDTPNIAAVGSSISIFVELSEGYQLPLSLVRNAFCVNADCDDGSDSFVLSPETYKAALRVFTKPGTYKYHSTSSGATGRVIVVDER